MEQLDIFKNEETKPKQYCLQCCLINGFPNPEPRNELRGKLITFLCNQCGHTLVDYKYECWGGECSENHMEWRLDSNNRE